MTESYKPREEFGGRLRRLREETGLNGKQFAERLGWPASKVSKLETGWQTAAVEDVRAWTQAAGCPTELLEDLLADLRSVRFEYATWRRQLRSGMAPRQRASTGVVAAATIVRAFEPAIVPGLLQTADYARQVLALAVAVHGAPNDVEAGVRARLRRQEALYVPGKHFRFLLTEAALRYRPCPPQTLLGQLDRLLTVAGLDTVEISVLPFETKLPLIPLHGFWIYDEALVLNETFNAELALRDAEDVALYTRVFEGLWQVAAQGEKAVDHIGQAIQELRRTTS